MDQPQLSKRRQRDVSLVPDKERCAEFALQGHDRLTERRLGHVELVGGAAKVQEIGHRREMPKLPGIHNSYPE
jgi:hypothetical protein